MTEAGQWPPILITRGEHLIIDGLHRYRAAQLLGYPSMACVISDAPEADAFVESVRRNLTNGLPLTLRDRKYAARVLLEQHGDWSDRRIGAVCAIDHGTVAALRADLAASPTGQNHHLDVRLGRDGRRRPVDYVSTRQRVLAALRAEPDASLRKIAQSAGVSPETVRTVKNQQTHLTPTDTTAGPTGTTGTTGTTAGTTPPNTAAAPEPHPPNPPPPPLRLAPHPPTPTHPLPWEHDPALQSTTETQAFLTWFAHTDMHDNWQHWINTIPLSRIYQIADEARHRADNWTAFARALEHRTHPTPNHT